MRKDGKVWRLKEDDKFGKLTIGDLGIELE